MMPPWATGEIFMAPLLRSFSGVIERAKLTVWIYEALAGLSKNEICALLKHRHAEYASEFDDHQSVIDGILTTWKNMGLLAADGDRYSIQDVEGLKTEISFIDDAED